MPRGRKPKALKEKVQAATEPVKVIEQVDLSNKEEFIKLLFEKGITAESYDGIVYATVKPEDISATHKVMEECKVKAGYRGSYGTGVGYKK